MAHGISVIAGVGRALFRCADVLGKLLAIRPYLTPNLLELVHYDNAITHRGERHASYFIDGGARKPERIAGSNGGVVCAGGAELLETFALSEELLPQGSETRSIAPAKIRHPRPGARTRPSSGQI